MSGREQPAAQDQRGWAKRELDRVEAEASAAQGWCDEVSPMPSRKVEMTGILDSFKLFHDQLISTTTYKQWASKNSGDATQWTNYSNAILVGKSPSPPKMSTGFGKALALTGQMILQKVAAGYGISSFGTDSYGEQ